MKKFIQSWLLRRLFKAVVFNDIEPWSKLSDKKRKQYISEARVLQEMELYRRLIDSLRWKASQNMFEKSKCWEDMFFGKATLYVIDLIDAKVKSISNKK